MFVWVALEFIVHSVRGGVRVFVCCGHVHACFVYRCEGMIASADVSACVYRKHDVCCCCLCLLFSHVYIVCF